MGGNIRRQLRPIVSFNTSMQHSDMINCSQCYLCKRCCRAFFTTVVQQTDVDDRWENDAERPAATGLQLCSYQGFIIQIASDAIITRYKDNIHSSCWLGRHETSVPITSICNLNILLSDIRLSTFLPRPELRGWRGLPPRLRRSASSCGLLF